MLASKQNISMLKRQKKDKRETYFVTFLATGTPVPTGAGPVPLTKEAVPFLAGYFLVTKTGTPVGVPKVPPPTQVLHLVMVTVV